MEREGVRVRKGEKERKRVGVRVRR